MSSACMRNTHTHVHMCVMGFMRFRLDYAAADDDDDFVVVIAAAV